MNHKFNCSGTIFTNHTHDKLDVRHRDMWMALWLFLLKFTTGNSILYVQPRLISTMLTSSLDNTACHYYLCV